MGWLIGLAWALGLVIVSGTILPLINSNNWWIRIFDFPRFQFAILGSIVTAFGLVMWRHAPWSSRVGLMVLVGAVITQFVQIYSYTPFKKVQTRVATSSRPASEISLLTANVLQDNRDATRLLQLIRDRDPDFVLLIETDPWWIDQVSSIEARYPHALKYPLTNYYGMVLYSKLPLHDPEIQFLVKKDIPSMRAEVELRDGRRIHLYGAHPEPPGSLKPNGGIRGTAPRDVELVLIARQTAGQPGPAIIAGDFNDVAWSHTTRLFQRLGKLLDPRVGRGFYSTFHAQRPLLRFPLDHLFHT